MKTNSLLKLACFACLCIMVSFKPNESKTVDETPPIITQWTLIDQSTQEVQKFPAKATATVTVGKEYLITCYAKDPEGLTWLQISASGHYNCTVNTNGTLTTKNVFTSWYPSEGFTFKPNKAKKVEPVLVYAKKFTVAAKYPCDHKFIPFEGTAENTNKLRTTGSLTLNIK